MYWEFVSWARTHRGAATIRKVRAEERGPSMGLSGTGEGWHTESPLGMDAEEEGNARWVVPGSCRKARTTPTPGEESHRPVTQPNGRLNEPHSDVEVDKTARTFEAAAALSWGGQYHPHWERLLWSGS